MRTTRAPGAVLLHPIMLASLLVLALNDHVLKRVCPGVLTGKLSDFAVVVVLPLTLQGVVELTAEHCWRRPLSERASNRWLVACLTLSLLVFALPELWKPAEDVYRYGLAALQRPFRAAWAYFCGRPLRAFRPVRATADVTDLLAMPMAWLALRVAWRGAAPLRRHAPLLLAIACALALWCAPGRALAAHGKARAHDGVYLSLEAGSGLAYIDSTDSISNGFRQDIPSTALAPLAPATSVAIGGTLPMGLVLGGRLGVSNLVHPVISTLGDRFMLPHQHFILLELGGMAQYYPDVGSGLHFGTGFGLAGLGLVDGSRGAAPGFFGSIEAGHGWFVADQWSVGLTFRLTAAHTSGRDGDDVSTTTLMPALLLSLTLH